jgi:hypothetical protein
VNGIDFIGDVHGFGDKLKGLLHALDYRNEKGAFRHHDRTVVFVGDLIDRGPQQLEVLAMVRSMVDAGSAQVVMGNHEFNAVSYVTPDPQNPHDFMRPRSGPKGEKNRRQHEAFLAQIGEHSTLHHEYVSWFRTWPLYLDLGDVRAVHACWHHASIEAVGLVARSSSGALPDEFFVDANVPGHPLQEAVEVLLKGPEVDLGPHGPYLDKDGHSRKAARIRWWDASARTLREVAEIPPGSRTPVDQPFPQLPDEPCSAANRYGYASHVPVFFGHYWFDGEPHVTSPRSACLDYSAILPGRPLVAYRWDGEPDLVDEHFVRFISS